MLPPAQFSGSHAIYVHVMAVARWEPRINIVFYVIHTLSPPPKKKEPVKTRPNIKVMTWYINFKSSRK